MPQIVRIIILIATPIWLCPLYDLWAQPEHSCSHSQSVPINLFSVMAKKKKQHLFSEKHSLLFSKENQRLGFHYSWTHNKWFFKKNSLISLLRNKYFSIGLNSLEGQTRFQGCKFFALPIICEKIQLIFQKLFFPVSTGHHKFILTLLYHGDCNSSNFLYLNFHLFTFDFYIA